MRKPVRLRFNHLKDDYKKEEKNLIGTVRSRNDAFLFQFVWPFGFSQIKVDGLKIALSRVWFFYFL